MTNPLQFPPSRVAAVEGANGLNVFDARSTADDVLGDLDLRGRHVLLTGASSGLGIETARVLVARGARVVGAVRSPDQAAAATAVVREAARDGGGLDLVPLNLASLASVRGCAQALLQREQPFDVVVANAGVMATPFARTDDGLEMQLATNHLGHFVLINRIASLMGTGSRLVVVASSSHRAADGDFDDLNVERSDYHPQLAYARSKLANVLFAVEFDRRHRDRGVRAAAVHPGTIRTGLGRHIGQDVMDQAVAQISASLTAQGEPPFQWKSVEQGAATSVWAGFVAPADEVGGRYCENCHVSDVVDASASPLAEGVSAIALDPATAARMWRHSEALVGERF